MKCQKWWIGKNRKFEGYVYFRNKFRMEDFMHAHTQNFKQCTFLTAKLFL